MFGPLYNQTVNLKTDSTSLQHSVLHSILKSKYNSSILKHNKGEKKYELPQKLCKQDISTKTHIQIDGSIFAPIGRMPWIILYRWEFLCIKDAGHRGNKITGGGSALKGYLSQASGIWKGGDFTSWYIWKGRKICHFSWYKNPKGLTGAFYGCEEVEKMFWFCDFFIS